MWITVSFPVCCLNHAGIVAKRYRTDGNKQSPIRHVLIGQGFKFTSQFLPEHTVSYHIKEPRVNAFKK